VKALFVGTQDLCVQSNPASYLTIHIWTGIVLLDSYWIGPGFIGLDAKILRPYKQMF
jgi:hypothetical protein